MVPFPGMGAIIRIPCAERFRAMSSCSFLIAETRIPASGMISYRVTVGPTVALISEIPTLKFLSSPTILFLFSSLIEEIQYLMVLLICFLHLSS